MVADSFCLKNHRCKISARNSIFSQVKNIWFSRYFLDESPPYFVDYDSRIKTASLYSVFKKNRFKNMGRQKVSATTILGFFNPKTTSKNYAPKVLRTKTPEAYFLFYRMP